MLFRLWIYFVKGGNNHNLSQSLKWNLSIGLKQYISFVILVLDASRMLELVGPLKQKQSKFFILS